MKRRTPMDNFSGLISSKGDIVPLTGIKVEGDILGRGARLRVSQRFRNREDQALEAVYKFPLPEGAAVCGFRAEIDGRTVVGEVEEREKAFEIYDKALSRGDGGYLLDQERPNIFTLSVGNLNPGAEAVVQIDLVTLMEMEGSRARFFLPTTISPRYAPAHMEENGGIPEEERVSPPCALDVPYGISLLLNVHNGRDLKEISSPSHPIRVELGEDPVRVSFSAESVRMDRDFILYMAHPDAGAAGRAYWLSSGEDVFVQLDLALDKQDLPKQNVSPRDREVIFLLDCSGSMDGDSISEAKRAQEICLKGLPMGARFNIVRFGSTHESLFKGPEAYGEKNLEKALRYTRRVDADMGGTEILRPLEAIYASSPGKGAPARSIVMLTDGEVCNEQEIMDLIRRHRANTRFFSLGIGAGPNEFFIRGTARAGMGASEFIHPGERIEPKVLRIFKKLTGPFLENAVVRWGAEAGEQAPAEASVSLGDPLTIFNRLSGGASLPETITVSGRMDGVPCSWEVPVVRSEGLEIPVPTLWARARIRDLEENKGALSGGGSRQRRGKQEKWKDQVLELSRAYGVLSGLTSFVAVEERREEDRTTGETVLRKVPTAVTVGWHGLGSTLHFGEIGSPAAVCSFAAPDEFLEAPKFTRMRSLFSRKAAPLSGPPPPMEMEAREPDRTDILLSILALQRADGGLALDQIVSDMLGLDFGKLRKEGEKMEAKGGEDRFLLLSTAILLKVLEIQFAAERSTWEGVTQKSRDWLAAVVDGTDPAIAGTALTAWAAAFVEEQVNF
jgi:Ca-activated chloride channel family protein